MTMKYHARLREQRLARKRQRRRENPHGFLWSKAKIVYVESQWFKKENLARYIGSCE